jgi:GNAT superfamily N-acetyltransferase
MDVDPGMVLPTVVIVLTLTTAIGVVNGFLIGYLRADAFVTTLATMLIITGACLVYTQGAPSDNLTQGFRQISEGSTLGLPNGIFLVIIAFAVIAFALRRTVWGRRVYAIGANPRVAMLTGQPGPRTMMSCYVLCSFLAGCAGLLLVARLHGEPVACGALRLPPGEPAEIKRLWVAPGARGLGVGRRVLAELEAHARRAGAGVVHLDTNRALRAATELYRSSGYVEVAPFNDEAYADHWFEKRLSPGGDPAGARGPSAPSA